MIHVESRNINGLRVEHNFGTAIEMMLNWNSESPAMGDNEILLVIKDGAVLYSSLGKKTKCYEDMLRTDELMEWFTR